MKVNQEKPQGESYSKPHKEYNNNLSVHLMSGSIAGITSTFCGHPLDTIKTRMQVLNDRFWHCCKTMVKQEGITSLYKGIQSPLLSSPITTATSFASYELAKRIVGIQTGQQITFGKALLSGGVAGFFYAVVSTPVELVKCRLQMEGAGQKQKAGGSFNMVANIVRKEGILGLYRGYWITCLRDMPGGAVQFGAYEALKNVFPNKDSRDTTAKNFVAGGLARFISWFFCHPQDLIKTKLQCVSGYAGISACAKEIWHTYGSLGFWRGSLPSITRTLISGSVTFAVYEEAKKKLSGL